MNIHRILFASFVALTFVFCLSLSNEAKTTCSQTFQGPYCVSEVPSEKFAQAFATQEMSQWCWAACISMIFRYNGHPVDQGRIVEATYGRRVNLPSGNGINMSKQIDREWVDDNGKRFIATLTAAFDPMAGYNTMNNDFIINELDKERPIIVGSGTHAMVGTAVAYYKTPAGPYIVNVGVFDPWPGAGMRGLTGCDIVPINNVCMPSPAPWYPPVMGKFIYAASTAIK